MSNYTTYKALEKPLSTEKYNIAVANRNADTIDSELNKLELKDLSQDEALTAESDRAKDAEAKLTDALDAEVRRARTAENTNAEAIRTERERSTNAESDLQDGLEEEISRAKGVEQLLNADLNAMTESVNAMDSRVTALDDKIDGLNAEDLGAVTPEDLDARINKRIIAGVTINGNDDATSDELKKLGISNELTVPEVFNKLPDYTTAIITSNSQQTAYSRSFPANEGAAQLIYNKAYVDRGTVLFLPIHGSRVWVGKLNSGAIEWTELAKSTDLSSYLPLQGGTMTGSLEVQGTVTASAFAGNASSASKAASADMLAGWEDTRNTATKPNDYNEKIRPAGLKVSAASGIAADKGGLYSTLVGIRGWKDSSGGKAHELGFTANGKIFHRVGDTDTWEEWQELAHVSDIPKSDGTASAAKLANARNIQTNLASGSPAAFDGTKNITPGVTGILPLANGGTGAADAAAARTKLEITPANIGAAPYSVVTGGDFNDITDPGVYTMRGNLTTNQPVTGGNYWGLIVLRSDNSEYYVEQIAVKEGTTEVYVRYCDSEDDEGNGEWSNWVRLARMTDTVAAATTAVNATKAAQDGNGNNIADTYAKKTDITVEWVGHQYYNAEDVAGNLTFTGATTATNANYILIADGGSSSSAFYDYGRVILITNTGANTNNSWITSTLGSYYSGSTARFSVDKTVSTITIKVPKSSVADVTLYRLKSL